MPSAGGSETVVMIGAFASLVVSVLVYVGTALGLTTWARAVARRRGGRGWKLAAWLPLLGLAATALGMAGTVLGLVTAFGSVASVDAASRSAVLAQGISEAMNATAFGVGGSILCFVLSAVISALGTFLRAPSPQP
jgi:MotA/TolQ/ExbB proton channel family